MSRALLKPESLNRTTRFSWIVQQLDGLNNSSDPTATADSETPDTLNTVYDLSGATETRKGVAKLITSTLPGPIVNEWPFYNSDGVTKMLIFAINCNNSATAPSNPPIAAVPTLVAGSGLGIGAYKYKITFVTGAGETQGGTEFSITTTTGNQQVLLSQLPTGGGNVTGRKIYRTVVGGATGAEKLVTTINDNTTLTYTDVLADGSLGANVPTSSTAGGLTGTYLYKYDNAGGGTLIGGPYTLNAQWDFTTYQNKVFAVDGFDGVLQYTGSGTVTQVNPTPLQYIETHKNRLWGLKRNSSTLQFCDAGNPASWPLNNFVEVNTDDGQVATGIKKQLDSIVVMKTNSVWYFVGEPLGSGNLTTVGNLQLRQADSEVGCISYKTIRKIRRGVLAWACPEGIAVMQNYHVDIISYKVDKTFQVGMNPNFLSTMWAIYYPLKKQYVLGFPSPTSQTPDMAILLDLQDQKSPKLSLWDHYPASCACLYRFTNVDSVLLGHPTKGYIVQAFQGYADIFGDNGTATAGTANTLTDSTKAWTTNQLVDADVTIVSGTGQGQQRTISSNTATQLTLSSNWTTNPDATSVYSIGAYNSYRDTSVEDFGEPAYDKKFRRMNIFADSESNYPMQFGHAVDFQTLSYNDPSISLSAGNIAWTGAGGANKWGALGAKWGKKKQLFLSQDIGDTGKHLQCRFGNNKANQPWRVVAYSISLKFKKVRPDNA